MTAARRAAPRAAPSRASGRGRASAAPRSGAPRAGAAPASAGGGRWIRVALLVLAVLVGLPLAHALFGEVVALLGSTMLLGFLVGRWTAPGR